MVVLLLVIILVILLVPISMLLIVGIKFFIKWRELVMVSHERTVARLYYTEESKSPEIAIYLDGMSVDEIIALVGAAEVAKNMILSHIPIENLDDDTVDNARDLLDGIE